MLSLIEIHNNYFKKRLDIEALKVKLENTLDEELKTRYPYRKAAIWIYVLDNLVQQVKGEASMNVIDDLVQKAVEEKENEADTEDNLLLAISLAQRYNNKKESDWKNYLNFVHEVEREFTNAFLSIPGPEIRVEWRLPSEI